jgi:ubiquitin C-terminal hydrolase
MHAEFNEVERTSVTVRQKRPVDYDQRALPIINPIKVYQSARAELSGDGGS